MRRVVVIVLLTVVAGGCAWGQSGYSGGQAFDNRGESQITPTSVGSLHEVWRFAGPNVVLGGGYAYASLNDASPLVRHALVAYREAGCTGTGVPTCAEAWHRDGRFSPPVSDGTSVFVVDQGANALQVLGTDGTPQWTFSAPATTGSTSTLDSTIRLDGGRAWVLSHDVDASAVETGRLFSVPAGGCGTATCAAQTTISGGAVNSFVVVNGTVVASRLDATLGAHLHAYNAATGSERWRSSEAGTVAAAGDGRVYAHLTCNGAHCAPGAVYDLQPGPSCTGTPLVCTEVAGISRMPSGPMLTAHHAIAVDDGGQLVWYANDCVTATTCPPLALFDTPEVPQSIGFAGGGGVVFTAGPVGVGGPWRIWAIDDALTGCSGNPSCPSIWTESPPAGVHGLAVSGGRLYAAEDDGLVHVYRGRPIGRSAGAGPW